MTQKFSQMGFKCKSRKQDKQMKTPENEIEIQKNLFPNFVKRHGAARLSIHDRSGNRLQ